MISRNTPPASNECSLPLVLVEPGPQQAQAIAEAITSLTGHRPTVVDSAHAVAETVRDKAGTIFAAAVSLDCPDLTSIIDHFAPLAVPMIVYGQTYEEKEQRTFSTISLADVVTTEKDALPNSVAQSMDRLIKNRSVAILVVDDSRSMRTALERFLHMRCYCVMEAKDGVEALSMLQAHPGIKLVITDNEMPNMDGYTLVKEIRKMHGKDEMAVIGISAQANKGMSVAFINNGANDFLKKPFVKEELYCRVGHNIEMLERIQLIRDLSHKDPLTRLYNRRFFFEHADGFLKRVRDEGKTVAVAMLDIDHFKAVNDTYGHDGGDAVLIHMADLLRDAFAQDVILARFGGEEFCFLTAHAPDKDVFAQYDALRRRIGAAPAAFGETQITVTVSVGLCQDQLPLATMLKKADERLYTAKESGRNRVVAS